MKSQVTLSKDATKEHPFVSRGGIKLAHALDYFNLDVTGLVALDVGASTGGFTDCLLQRGAKKVYALDVGYGQLAWKLRTDSRVVVIERTNIRYWDRHQVTESIDLAVIDVSFISLTLVLPKVKEILASHGSTRSPCPSIVALIKPNFEVGKGQVGKKGVVREPEKHRQVIEKIRALASTLNLKACGVTESPLTGPEGNKEFCLLLTPPS